MTDAQRPGGTPRTSVPPSASPSGGWVRGIAGVMLGMLMFAASTSSALAAPPLIEPTELAGIEAKRSVNDRTFRRPRPQARIATVAAQQWVDPHGHVITISSGVPGVDLAPFAGILAGTRHGDEIEALRVEAVTVSQIGPICGDAAAIACYAADDATSSSAGQMWFAVDDPDVVHTIVHEYGHHVDNQLLNFFHLGLCSFDNDGSRNWFFERDVEDDVLGAGLGCSSDTEWEYLLGEVYAEDFVALNGILNWTLPSVRSPTRRQLNALDYDMRVPLDPMSRTWRPRMREGRGRFKTITLKHWTFLTVTLRSPSRRDFDLFLYRPRMTRPFARSTRTGRFDRIERLLRPGKYDIGVYAYRGSGRGRVAVHMD